jgi:ABC-2 type transport system ATP-binding protein
MAISTDPRAGLAPPREAEPVGDERLEHEGDREWRTDVTIDVRGAGKRYGENWVVRDLTFDIAPGTIYGLFGPSGSGKTTTLRLVLGLVGLDEGEIRVLGVRPRRFKARTRARIGYMPQLFVLYPEMSVSENVNLVASLYGMGWLKRRKPVRQTLEFVELWEDRGKIAGDLSGGMKRRLELATALLHDPDLIIVDEPTAGIDPILRQKLWEHFRALRDQGRTIVVTSQYVTEAEYCDEIAVLGNGRIIAAGTPEEVRRRAIGGAVVDVEADGLDRRRVQQLLALEGVQGARVLSYDHLQLTVDEAGPMIPRVLSSLQDGGVEVRQVQEYRPNFDEVFVKLMEDSGAGTESAD